MKQYLYCISVLLCIFCHLPSYASDIDYKITKPLPPMIPHPSNVPGSEWANFDPFTAVPPTHEEALANGWNVYYINNTAPTATDSNNPNGTKAKPRLTIPEITYPAKSAIFIVAGGSGYSGGYAHSFKAAANTTASSPVWFIGLNAQETPDFASQTAKPQIEKNVYLGGKHVYFDNLWFTGKSDSLQIRAYQSNSLHYIMVRNSYFDGDASVTNNGAYISIYGESPTNRFSNIVVYQNTLHKGGDAEAVSENDVHGIKPSTNVDFVWVGNNHIFEFGGDSIQIGNASTSDANRPSHVFVFNNDFHDNLENSVDVKEADKLIIAENVMYNFDQKPGNSSTGANVVVHNTAKDVWFINNLVFNAQQGFVITGGSTNIWLVGNVIRNIEHASFDTSWDPDSLYSMGAAVHYRGGSTGGIVHNHIEDYDKGIEAVNGTLLIYNNSMVNRNTSAGHDILFQESSLVNQTDNNNAYQSQGGYSLKSSDSDTSSLMPNFTFPRAPLAVTNHYKWSEEWPKYQPSSSSGGVLNKGTTSHLAAMESAFFGAFDAALFQGADIHAVLTDFFGQARYQTGDTCPDIGAIEDEGLASAGCESSLEPPTSPILDELQTQGQVSASALKEEL